jgi:hypothetical protein
MALALGTLIFQLCKVWAWMADRGPFGWSEGERTAQTGFWDV